MSRMADPRVHFTVVIPTRERGDVLSKSLKTVTAQDYGALEILVSDNCSTDQTRDVVAAANDPRVRYLNTGERLSMSRNWEFALSHVNSGWITILGDDDGLMPGALNRVAALIGETGTRAIRSTTCYYAWPSLSPAGYGRLRVPTGSGHVVRDSRQWLTKVMRGEASYTQLPMLYSGGFVDFSVMQKLRSATGSFYRSCIPDVYSAIAIASLIENYVFSSEPFAINGASKHSIGTSTFGRDRQSVTSPAKTFGAEANLPFHKDVPLSAEGALPASIQAIVYESFLQTIDIRGDEVQTDHANQLELILGSAEASNASIREWCRDFAQLHELNFASIERRSSSLNPGIRARYLWDRFVAGVNNYSTDWDPGLIRDVYDASIAAAAIRGIAPSRLRNLARGIKLLTRKRS